VQGNEQHRFRVTAAIGLAIACTTLGAPFALMRLGEQDWLVAAGGLSIAVLLCLHALLMRLSCREARWTLGLVSVSGIGYLVHLVHSFGVVGLLWCFPGVLGLYCLLPERIAWLANAILLLLVLVVGHDVLPHDLLLRAGATLLAVSLFAVLLLRAVTEQFSHLQRRIVTDPLTGLLNRHELEFTLESCLDARRHTETDAALLALDIDHFKQVNDRHGHAVGDEVLRIAGRMLGASIRSTDRAFRLGGEEFLVVLGGSDARLAVERAETLRLALAGALSLPGYPITVSIGVAIAVPSDSRSQWMSRADDALYRAKGSGRDRVCVALRVEPDEPSRQPSGAFEAIAGPKGGARAPA